MDIVSQNQVLAFTIKHQMDCAYLCDQMQKFMNNYQKLNGNLDNVIMTIRLQKATDHAPQVSPLLIEYNGEHQTL